MLRVCSMLLVNHFEFTDLESSIACADEGQRTIYDCCSISGSPKSYTPSMIDGVTESESMSSSTLHDSTRAKARLCSAGPAHYIGHTTTTLNHV